jgi:hypothetical protein
VRQKLKEVRRIELYRRNGVPAFTDMETADAVNKYTGLEPELIERISKMRAEPGPPINDPLFTRAVEKQTLLQSYENLETGRVLTLYQPLKNLKDCQECHNRDHSVRGVLRISLGLDQLDAELSEARNQQRATSAKDRLLQSGYPLRLVAARFSRPIRIYQSSFQTCARRT